MRTEEISIYIDPVTGVHYLITETGAICPRYNQDHSLYIDRLKKAEKSEHDEDIHIHEDPETGVNYLISLTGDICPRYNPDGSLYTIIM